MDKASRSEPTPLSYVVHIIVNAVLLGLISRHDSWRPLFNGVVTDAFPQAMWALYLSCGGELFSAAVLLLMYPAPAMGRFLKVVTSALGIVSAVVMYQVFPFDFSRFGPWANPLARLLMFAGILASGLGAAVALVKFVFGGGPKGTPAHLS